MGQAMDHSLITAGSGAHLKIVAVALIGAILVVMVGIANHASQPPLGGRTAAMAGMIVKAGVPATYSGHDRSTVR
jgi:hypothetical protein